MAANRKLQQTVEATLRKVDEGLAEFEQYWKKVEEAPNPSQREKAQSDLKREIKKLQRFRDDIMKWASSSEVKDKLPLQESRRKIEIEMEKFKAYERESKTKPFSYMGLQMGEKLDASDIKRQEKREEIEEFVATLQQQLDAYQVDWETISARKKKSDQPRLDDLKKKTTQHGYHLLNLELLLRKMDNEDVELDDLDMVTDNLQLYLSDHDTPDYIHDEEFYGFLNLNDSVDASYYRPALNRPRSESADAEAAAEEERKRKEREQRAKEIPLSAAAKAKAFKKDGVAAVSVGAGLHAPAPIQPPPLVGKPSAPNLEPPALPVFRDPPNRPVPARPVVSIPVAPSPPSLVTPSPLALSFANRPFVEDTIARHKSITLSTIPFASLAIETLLFIFYYRADSFSQLRAAKELNSRGFRYHRKSKQWIRAVGEVKIHTDYELGTFVSIDPESLDWKLKEREGMVVEFGQLEEEICW